MYIYSLNNRILRWILLKRTPDTCRLEKRFANCFKPCNICVRAVPAAETTWRFVMQWIRIDLPSACILQSAGRSTARRYAATHRPDQFKFALLPRSRARDTPVGPTPNTGNSGLLGWTALGFRFIRSIRGPCPAAGITPGDRSSIRSSPPPCLIE